MVTELIKQMLRYKKALVYLSIVGGFSAILISYYVLNYNYHLIPAPLVELARKSELIKTPPAKTCSECHAKIFESWQKSRHSKAWVSEFYTEDSENHSKEKCLPCHVPQTVNPGQKPDPRLDNRDDGVYCVSCHLKDGEMRGPYDLFSPSHPTREVGEFRKSVFCGSCHEKTYKEWMATDRERSCQSCHMPRVMGRLTQKFPLSFLHRKRQVADHSFPHGGFDPDNILLELQFENEKASLSLTNLKIPHGFPTADNGDPRLYVYISFLDAQGEEVTSEKEIIAPQKETALPWQKAIVYPYRVNAKTEKARVSIQYKLAWSKEKKEVLVREFQRGDPR